MLGSDGLPPSAALLLGGTLMCIVGFKASRRGSSWMREEKLEFDAASRPAEDVNASGDGLEQATPCALPPQTLPPSNRLAPFVVLHEPHVGEGWLVQLLQAQPVQLFIAREGEGRAKDAARRWLVAVRAMSGDQAGVSSGTRRRFANLTAGLVLTPRALREVNRSRLLPPALWFSTHLTPPPAAAVRLLTLTRRNRVKHALSRYVRVHPRASGRAAAAAAPAATTRGNGSGVEVPAEELRALLELGAAALRTLLCTASSLVGSALRLHYEQLLYEPEGTLRRVAAHLGLPVFRAHNHSGAAAPSASTGAAALAELLPAKRSPNSLCMALVNYAAVCAALRGSAWEADLGPASGSCRCADQRSPLVFAGSHHKTGTLFLERVRQLERTRSGRMPRREISHGAPFPCRCYSCTPRGPPSPSRGRTGSAACHCSASSLACASTSTCRCRSCGGCGSTRRRRVRRSARRLCTSYASLSTCAYRHTCASRDSEAPRVSQVSCLPSPPQLPPALARNVAAAASKGSQGRLDTASIADVGHAHRAIP